MGDLQSRWAPLLRAVSSGATERDRAGEPLSRDLLREAGKVGLLGLGMPIDAGGAGLDAVRWGSVLEQIGYACDDMSFSLLVSLFPAVGIAIHQSGRADLIERYVAPIVRGERLAAFAWTEDADAFSFASRVRRADGGFVLSGRKVMVSGGMQADTFMTYVRDERDDVAVFLVERDDPGVAVVPVDAAGLRAAGLAILILDEVRLPSDRRLAETDGISHVQRLLNRRRLMLTCGPVGRMRAMAEAAALLLETTKRYGRPLSQMQSVQSALGRIVARVETSRLILHGALAHLNDAAFDPLWDATISAAKYTVTENALFVGTTCLRLLGGRAYTRDLPYERSLRDFLGLLAGAGAQDVLEADLGMLLTSASSRSADRESS